MDFDKSFLDIFVPEQLFFRTLFSGSFFISIYTSMKSLQIKTSYLHLHNKVFSEEKIIYYSGGACDGSFYPIFNKRFDHLETLLAIHRPKKVLSAGSLCGRLVPSPQSICPKRTFMLPQKYHASVSNMLS